MLGTWEWTSPVFNFYLPWNSHIDRITGYANRTLGFIRRNICTKLTKVRETAYNTLVRPQLEFASPI